MEYYGIFDTHVHLDDERFDTDREELINALPSLGVVRVCNIGADMPSSLKTAELANKYDHIYGAVGVHPHEAKTLNEENLEMISRLATENRKIVAIGEIGLDYHYDLSPRDVQRYWFKRQMELAVELDMPVVLHIREAYEDALEIIKFFGKIPKNGVVHCFGGSVEFANEVLKFGYKIGIGGVVTFSNAKKLVNVTREVDIKDILLETDCPYMAPTPHRGERNNPAFSALAAEKIAEIKGLGAQEVIDITRENADLFYQIV